MQARLTDIFSLHHTDSRISVNSIASFAENVNTRKAYKQFCRNLYQVGVTENMIRQKEKEILEIFRTKSIVASSQTGDSNIGNQGQSLAAGLFNR